MSDPTVCVHGLGYVGLPTAVMFAKSGFKVLGYDTNQSVRDRIHKGLVPYDEPELETALSSVIDEGRLSVVNDVEPADFHCICVPTSYREEDQRTDLRYVRSSAETIASVLRPGDTIILESTVPPGTTTEVVREVLRDAGVNVGENVTLAYSPETVLPGQIMTELRENDRIVGVTDEVDATEVVALYKSFVEGDIWTTDATTAEFVKLIQNAYRDTNIAFANETAKLGYEHGIDSREAIRLANEHPRVDILSPGPGVGGHCLPIDPLFLKNGNDRAEVIEAARGVNDRMVEFVKALLEDAVGPLEDTRIALLGIAYKGGIDDTRNSPGIKLAGLLGEIAGVSVTVHDPRVESAAVPTMPLGDATAGADVVVLVTDHPEFNDLNPKIIGDRMRARTLIDTRAMLDEQEWRNAGFNVWTI